MISGCIGLKVDERVGEMLKLNEQLHYFRAFLCTRTDAGKNWMDALGMQESSGSPRMTLASTRHIVLCKAGIAGIYLPTNVANRSMVNATYKV